MKKKIFSIFLSCFMILSTSINSFAMPIAVAVPISYEALMALMGVGVAFGLALPKDDSEYYDYTNSLRNHLQVVDDKYLELLDKSVKEWKDNNDHKPEGEKDKLKIPYIPELSQLFENVGNDVSTSYKYVNTVLNPILYVTSDSQLKDVHRITLTPDDIGYFDFTTSDGVKHTWYIRIDVSSSGTILKSSFDNKNLNAFTNLTNSQVSSLDIGLCVKYSSGVYKLYASVLLPNGSYKTWSLGKELPAPITKPAIEYIPKEPSIEEDKLPIELPNINIPNIDDFPEYEGLTPPFEVAPPYSPGTDSPGTDSPGTDSPGTDSPGTDSPGTNEGLFPDKGSITDYIKSLIVPSDSFWTDTFNEFRTNLGKNFPMLDMSKFDSLLVNGKPFPNIYAYGSKVVDGDIINSIVDWLRPIIAGFIMICLMFFNYRKVYKVIRNSEPFGNIAPGTSDFSTGLSSADIKQIVADAKREAERRTYRR